MPKPIDKEKLTSELSDAIFSVIKKHGANTLETFQWEVSFNTKDGEAVQVEE